jgi:protoporphyrinogen/coproporphyrinogen III oxidase
MMDVDVAVIGGGIAGLATAYELSRLGLSFVVFERADRAGGVILSEEVDGFTIDGGPDALLIQKPDAIKLCEEIGLADRLVPTKPPRLAYIQRGGCLHPLPAASVLGIPTRIGPFLGTKLFSLRGKLRMGAERFVPPRRDGGDESIGAFIRRRFGREAVDYLAEPLLAGIHAGDVEKLSLLALFPRFAEAERRHGSLLRAFGTFNPFARTPNAAPRTPNVEPRTPNRERTLHPEPRTPNPPREGAFLSLPGGLSEMVRALIGAIGRGAVRTGVEIERISGNGPFTVHPADGPPVAARAVVLATPAFVTADLVRDRDARLAKLCGGIVYASAGTIALAFRRDAVAHPLNGSGFVVPRREKNGILAGSWLSSKWPNRAPDGSVLLRTFVGGARDPWALGESDEELVERSLDALRPLLGITGDPLFTRIYRWDRSSAQHNVGHLDRVASIDRRLASHPGLFVTGSGFRGTGIPDCIADARATARQIATWLGQQPHQSATTERTEETRRAM